MARFVILRHETPAGYPRPSHWDFMLESEEILQTWALFHDPRQPTLQQAEVLGDHRLAYLELEGPLSGDRGHVVRWDQGSYEVIDRTEGSWKVALDGRRLQGIVFLCRDEARPDQFQYRFATCADHPLAT